MSLSGTLPLIHTLDSQVKRMHYNPVFLLLVECVHGDVYLENNTSGILRICYNSIWRLVCDDEWDEDDATVVCNQLGLIPGSEYCLAL